MKPTLKGRCIGILISDGTDASALKKLKKSVESEGARVKIVASKINGILLSDKSEMKADGQLAGTPSQIFDGVALVLSADGVQTLLKDASAIQWVADAYAHLKAIGLNPDAQPLLKKANVKTDEGITELDETFLKAASTVVVPALVVLLRPLALLPVMLPSISQP